ncbi:MAG: DUF6599 family protein [Sedimentisphaerales bacterium]
MPQFIQNHRRQTIISCLIIVSLILIAVAVGLKQKFYQKPASDSLTEPKATAAQTILSADIFDSNFSPVGDTETYNSHNLYEKIDGRDDLYLGNGFISLQYRRFADKSAKNQEAEVYLYDMASAENAFAVYSLQKRSESTPLDWAQFGYSTPDSVYAAFSKYYVEIILSSENNALLTSAQNAAKKLSSAVSAGKTVMPVFDLFPAENLVTDSFKFINADAFGCSDLKNIFTAEYKINNNLITAYIRKTDPGQLYEKYYHFLIDNGAEELSLNYKLPAYRAYNLFGTNEIFFFTREYFAGVRGPAPIKDMQIVFEKLFESLSSQKNEQR